MPKRASPLEPYAEAIDDLLGRPVLLRIDGVLGELADEGDDQAMRERRRLRRRLEL